MGKVKWNTKATDIDEAEERESDFEPYEGEVPPAGVYRVALRFARVTQFDSGNGGLTMLWVVEEPKSSAKARYNGAPLFERLVDVDTQAWKIKQFLRAIGGTGRHWATTLTTTDDRDNEVVTKWGNIVADGLTAKVQVKRGSYNGDPRAEVARWLPKKDEDDASGDDDSGSDASGDDQAPF